MCSRKPGERVPQLDRALLEDFQFRRDSGLLVARTRRPSKLQEQRFVATVGLFALEGEPKHQPGPNTDLRS